MPSTRSNDYSKPLGLILLLVCASSAAQETVPGTLLVCSGVDSDVERLACYDRAIARLISQDPETLAQPAPSPEAVFGSPAGLGRKDGNNSTNQRRELRSIEAHVTGVGGSHGQDPYIELDNGQVWQQLGGTDLRLRTGDQVRITRAALDSFKLVTASGRYVRVRRVR